MKDANARVTRWSLSMQPFHFIERQRASSVSQELVLVEASVRRVNFNVSSFICELINLF